jgi:UDP-N-acetylmuramoylalanine-D-glutamate ligase
MKNINNKINVAVIGLGKSGIAAANLASSKGYNVFASDSGKVKTHSAMKLIKKLLLNSGNILIKFLKVILLSKARNKFGFAYF